MRIDPFLCYCEMMQHLSGVSVIASALAYFVGFVPLFYTLREVFASQRVHFGGERFDHTGG
jgi:hypothetical protein